MVKVVCQVFILFNTASSLKRDLQLLWLITSLSYIRFLFFLINFSILIGVSFSEAKIMGLTSSNGRGAMPRDMLFPVPKGCSWHDLYDYIRYAYAFLTALMADFCDTTERPKISSVFLNC